MPRALLSVSDKRGIAELGRGLAARGFELVSTGGTARALADAGLPVTGVSALTGFPEMMDGRVKTLHPALHGGILARRDHPEDLAALDRHGIGLVDLVVVNLYPFAQTAKTPGVTFDELVEQIDIGGPSLVRAAAKNFRDVLVVVDPGDYDSVLAALDRPGGPSIGFRFGLMRKAFTHTADYDETIADTLDRVEPRGGSFALPIPVDLVARDAHLYLHQPRHLRYGENPHQRAAWFNVTWDVLQGKELSYTNLLDLDAAQRIVAEFDEPAAVVIKHTNPCGAATGASAAEAYVRARDADPLSAFGGIVGVNRPLDAEAAKAITSTFIEAVSAPGVNDEARAVFAAKANLRLVIPLEVVQPAFDSDAFAVLTEMRTTSGGVLLQEPDRVTEARSPWPDEAAGVRVVTKRQPTAEEWEGLRFAWRICAHVKSNAVIFTDAHRTLAIGAGQTSRVDAVKVAVMKAGSSERSLRGSVAASDAFFPFRDGLDALAQAGATAVVQPGGSVRDAEVVAAADEHGLAMVFTGRRHFRH